MTYSDTRVALKPAIQDRLSLSPFAEETADDLSRTSDLPSSYFISTSSKRRNLIKTISISTTSYRSKFSECSSSKFGDIKDKTTIHQILNTINFFRFRLERLTGTLGGKKDGGGKGSLGQGGRRRPPNPSRSRNEEDKLKKSTEKLGNINVKKGEHEFSPKVPMGKGKQKSKSSVVRTNPNLSSVSSTPSASQNPPSEQIEKENKKRRGSEQQQTTLTDVMKGIPFRSASIPRKNLSADSKTSTLPTIILNRDHHCCWGSHTLPRRLATSSANSARPLTDCTDSDALSISASFHDISSKAESSQSSTLNQCKCFKDSTYTRSEADVTENALTVSQKYKRAYSVGSDDVRINCGYVMSEHDRLALPENQICVSKQSLELSGIKKNKWHSDSEVAATVSNDRSANNEQIKLSGEGAIGMPRTHSSHSSVKGDPVHTFKRKTSKGNRTRKKELRGLSKSASTDKEAGENNDDTQTLFSPISATATTDNPTNMNSASITLSVLPYTQENTIVTPSAKHSTYSSSILCNLTMENEDSNNTEPQRFQESHRDEECEKAHLTKELTNITSQSSVDYPCNCSNIYSSVAPEEVYFSVNVDDQSVEKQQFNKLDMHEASTNFYCSSLQRKDCSSCKDNQRNSLTETTSECYRAMSGFNDDKFERKKKYLSDPGCDREDAVSSTSFFSDSNIDPAIEKERTKNFEKRTIALKIILPRAVVSQASTDSEGREEFLSPCDTAPTLNPLLTLSGHESDSSCHDNMGIGDGWYSHFVSSRNASPTPYFGDSDSGEKTTSISPRGPRRYSKRPLRGPYGEMLEAEMNKTKSNSQYLPDELFLRPQDNKYISSRPSSPSVLFSSDNSPTILVADSSTPVPLTESQSRSYEDYSSDSNCQISDDRGIRMNLLSPSRAYDSDSETRISFLPSVPVHQRTASSPSKLYAEPDFSKTDEKQTLEMATKDPHGLTVTKLSVKNKHEKLSKASKMKKTQEESHHAPAQQLVKKGSFEVDLRNLNEHRLVHRRHRDTRAHILEEVYNTEKNYVDNLNFLLTRYRNALSSPESNFTAETALCEDIFFQVPEIHAQHERLLEEMRQRFETRDANVCVGDLLLELLENPDVIESYKSFVNNWKTAQESTKAACQAKPAFRNFLSAMAKEHPRKLDLKALLIKPVQRFPHYELILKRLLEHTCEDHPDYNHVKEAIAEVQKVAASINDIELEALQIEQQQFILKEIENFMEGLVGLVQPDRTFLQLDQVSQNSALGIRKERCLFLFSDILVISSIKRRSATMRKSSSLQLPHLTTLESCKLKLFKLISLDDLEIGRSRDDSIKKLVKELQNLEEDIQNLSQISRLAKSLHCPRGSLEDSIHDLEVSLKKQLIDRQGADSQLSELELNITTQEGIETLTFTFSGSEKRNKWEEVFNAAKQKLAMSADRRPPPEFVTALPVRKTRAGLQFTCASPTLGLNAHNLRDVWVCNSDGYVGQVCVMSLQPEPTLACCNGVCNAKILSIASIPAAPQPDSSDDDEDEDILLDDDIRKRRSESLPPEIGIEENENEQPTMWLGTEDGSIHVYNCSDTIRTKKNKLKFQPGSPVHCIIHIEYRVFAALANGDIVVYERDVQGGWSSGERHVINLGSAAAPVTRMVVAAGKLWCSAGNSVKVLNINSLQIERSFAVGGETNKGVACMVSAGHGVWISLHFSAVVRLYLATTHECVCEVVITSAVTKMLANCDDIIRQHKLACLKVTSLLACKDLLWIGTSAGVIITLPLPHLSHNTRRLQSSLNLVGITHGHTGNVRFLTSVEMTPEPRPSRLKSHSRYSFKGKDHSHHQPGTAAPTKVLVISGGDGYEDFRSSGLSEMAGRDDSTNHLLLWQV